MAPSSSSRPRILLEDEWLIAFDKPSGLLTAAAPWDKVSFDLASQVRRHLASAIHPVHRLDPETSGVLLCAKTETVLMALARLFESGRCKIRYLALVVGSLPEPDMVVRRGLDADGGQPDPMGAAESRRRDMRQTRVHTLEIFRAHSLLEVWPIADTPHQVRDHLAHLGCPAVADARHGNGRGLYLSEIKSHYKFKPHEPERPLIGRAALHAESLTLTHPVTHAKLTISAPWPKDFSIAMKYLKKFALTGGMPLI